MRNHRRSSFLASGLLVAAACALPLVTATAPAAAQFSVSDPGAQSVMSSRDFNALLEAIAFDASQRATVGPLFDDMQIELIAARDELAATAAPARNADSRTLADFESRKRRSYQRMSAAEQTFFDGLSALASADQQPAVERERLAATRRLIRRTLGPGQSSAGPVRVDFVSAIDESKLSDADQARALGALTGYQAQLTALLRQALDQGLEVDAKIARLREQKPAAQAQPEAQAEGAFEVVGMMNDPTRREATAAFDATCDKLAALHLQAMGSLEGALDAVTADSLAASSAKRIWPRAAMDPRSPRAAFAQMRAEIARGKRPSEQLAALDAAQPAWLSAWWTATRKACEAENALRPYGMFAVANDETKALRRTIRDAHAQRDEANRAAWRALAALDAQNSGFYADLVAAPDANRDMMRFAGHSEPTPPSIDGSEPGPRSGASFSSAVMIMTTASDDSDGDDEPGMPIVMEAFGDGPISISMGPDGVATFSNDTVGDGMAGGGMGVFTEIGGPSGPQLSGARMPAPMTRDQVLQVVRAIAGEGQPPAAIEQIYKDYSVRAQAVDDSSGKAARDLLTGSMLGFTMHMGGDDAEQPKERSMEDLRAGVGKLDTFVAELVTIDDALIADVVAASAPHSASALASQAAQLKVLQQERARDRLQQLRYPSSPMLMHQGGPSTPHIEFGAVVRSATLSPADRAAADTIVSEWSDAAIGAAEQARSTLRSVSLDLLESERKMRDRADAQAGAQPGGEPGRRGGAVRMEMSFDDAEGFREHQALIEKAGGARTAVASLARGTRERLETSLSPEGRVALLAAWCRFVAPEAYADRRNADTQLAAALAIADLTPEQRRQIDALRASHATQHAALTERIGQLAADLAVPSADAQAGSGPMGAGFMGRGQANPARSALDRARFDRSELNERSTRRLRSILTPTQAEAIPPLGKAQSTTEIIIGPS